MASRSWTVRPTRCCRASDPADLIRRAVRSRVHGIAAGRRTVLCLPIALVVMQSFEISDPGQVAVWGLDGWRAALSEPVAGGVGGSVAQGRIERVAQRVA
jgi:hypothetical protein